MSEITVRTNLFLWMLTGRTDDYQNASLNNGIRYSVKDTPPEVLHARSLLKLDVTSTDFHVLACLAAARMSTSLMRSMPEDIDGVFVNGLLALPAFSLQRLVGIAPTNAVSWPSVDGLEAGRRGFTRVTFREDGGEVVITTDAGTSERSPYTILQVASGPDEFKVTVDKAADYGIKAAFRVESFNLGDTFTVNLGPTRYPFSETAAKIEKDSVMTRLMNAEGTLSAFSESSNPAKKVGMAALAVIRRMIRLINEDQAGFEVTSYYDATSDEPLGRKYSIDPAFVSGLDDPEVDDEAPVGFDA